MVSKVAVKTLKEKFDNIGSLERKPEIRALRSLSHPNIVQCKDVLLDKERKAHLVFELMTDGNLETFCRERSNYALSEAEIASIAYQILSALEYLHSSHFLHRDIKPENILLSYPRSNLCDSKRHQETVPIAKLADLGLAKNIARPTRRPFTGYVATRWYRAPEQLLRLPRYGPAADLWAFGLTLAEIVTLGKPIFPGKSERDQLRLIVANRGHPAVVGWKDGAKAMAHVHPTMPLMTPCSISCVLKQAPPLLVQLVEDLLQLDPRARPTAQQALAHPFFRGTTNAGLSIQKPLHSHCTPTTALSPANETQLTHLLPTSQSNRSTRRSDCTSRLTKIPQPSLPLFKIPRRNVDATFQYMPQTKLRSPAGTFNVKIEHTQQFQA